MLEGAAALFIAPGLAALGRLIAPAFAVFGRLRLFPPGLDAAFGRFAVATLYPAFGRLAAAPLYPPLGRFAAPRLLPAFGRFAGLTLAMELPGFWLGVLGRAP